MPLRIRSPDSISNKACGRPQPCDFVPLTWFRGVGMKRCSFQAVGRGSVGAQVAPETPLKAHSRGASSVLSIQTTSTLASSSLAVLIGTIELSTLAFKAC